MAKRSLQQIEESLRGKFAEDSSFMAEAAIDYTKENYLTWANQYASQHKVPLPLVLHAMYNETGWMNNPNKQAIAKSPKGARGVMQLMPQYAKDFGIDKKDLTDPQKNIEAGVRLLGNLFNQYKNPQVALAAYNAGPNNKRFKQYLETGDPKVLPRETRKYISGYTDDVKDQLGKFFQDKKLAKKGTNLLAAVTGAVTAHAADEISRPVPGSGMTADDKNFDEFIKRHQREQQARRQDIEKSTEVLKNLEKGKQAPSGAADATTVKLTPDQAKKLPSVDMFGHIMPGVETNKAGGIARIGTRPYVMPDGTVITDKRTLADIRSLQQRPDTKTDAVPDEKTKDSSWFSDWIKKGRDVQAQWAAEVPKTQTTTAPETGTRTISGQVGYPKKDAAEKPAAKVELQKDQAGLVKAKRELSDFERAFAAARAEKGPGETFSYTDPKTGKTGLYTTFYKGEKPTAKTSTTVEPAQAPTDRFKPAALTHGELNKAVQSFTPVQSIDKIEPQANEPDNLEQIIKAKHAEITPDAPLPTEQDIEAAKARSQKHLADIDRELADKALVKESINTQHAELQDILRLAGKLK